LCCHPGNSRETQITSMSWGLAHAYRAALFNTVQCPKGERGENEAAGTATGAAPPAGPAAPPAQQAVTAPRTGTTTATATIAGKAPVAPVDPGVHREERGQEDEGGSPSPLHCPSEASYGVLCPVLGSPLQERLRATGESPAEGYKDDEGTGTSPL